MQNYPNITELFASTRKMLTFIFLFCEAEDEAEDKEGSINSLISSGTCSTPKLLK